MAEKVLVLALLLAFGIVAYDDIYRQNNFPPRPSRFLGVALIFSVLAIVAVPAPALAAAFAIAADLGLALKGTGQGQQPSQAGGVGIAVPRTLGQIPQLRGNSVAEVA